MQLEQTGSKMEMRKKMRGIQAMRMATLQSSTKYSRNSIG